MALGSKIKVLAVAIPFFLTQPGVSAAQERKALRPLSLEKLEFISGYLNGQVADKKIPGAVVLIQRHGEPVFLRSFGVQDVATNVPMSPDTLFAVYSMTKLVTSVAAMMLIDEGKLKLDDLVSEYIPAFAQAKVGVEAAGSDGKPALRLVPPLRPVTIQHLMTHTAGIGYDNTGSDLIKNAYRDGHVLADDPDNKTVAERVARLPLASQPGALWRYGYATDVLGHVIEIVSGQPLYEFLKQRLFDPLGMNDTKFLLQTDAERARMAEPMPTDAVMNKSESARRARTRWQSGGGGLVGTIGDFSRFGEMLLRGGELDGRRYLSREAFGLMTTDKVGPRSGVVHDELYYPGDGFGFGLGFAVRTGVGVLQPPRAGSIGELKWDSGSGTYFGVDPQESTVFILMQQTGVERGRIVPTVKRLFYEAFEDRRASAE